MIDRTSVEILPAHWRTRAKTLRRYGSGTSAVALEACAAELETALRQRDDTILTLTEAAGGKAATLPLTWDAWCARARSRTPEGPAHPGSLEGTSPMRPGRWPSLVWRRSLRCARFRAGGSCSPSSRRVSDDGTKRSRRSYSAGERGRNRVLVFPDPGTGLLRIEWREGGRRLTKSLGHRDWDRAKRQADASRCRPRPALDARGVPPTPVCSGALDPRASSLARAAIRFQCGRSSARCQATPAPARILPPTSRGAACSGSTPPLSRSPRRAGSRSRARVRPGAPRSAPGASPAPAPSGSPSLARAQLCRSGAPSLAQLQPHGRHMDATTNSLALHCHRLSS